MSVKRRLLFWLAYWRGRTPWDTRTTPPELVRTIEGPDALPPGRALDLGCGTGTNVIYLAQRGWEAVGIDFVHRAIRRANKKARAAGVTARFMTGDVSRLDRLKGLDGVFDLVLDIGCFHSLSADQRPGYADGVKARLRPGGVYMLYAWEPREWRGGTAGVSRAQVEALFGPELRVTRVERGTDRDRSAAWYWLERVEKN